MRDESWRPEPRPGWVERMNRTGRLLGEPESVVPLDEVSLLDAARSIADLDDFGPDDWREPFRLLLADLAEHAELNFVGRVLARYDLVHSLIVRLQMAEVEKQHPEILEQPIKAPVIITGMGRTGTSILYELMAEDPQWRVPTGWELRYPSPPPDEATRDVDPRVGDAGADIALWYDIVPEFLGMHETSTLGAEEDVVAIMHQFTAASWSGFHHVPNFELWVATKGAGATYRFHRRLFQHLQFRSPGRWLWKGPAHLSTLPQLFAEYPDARIVMTHRDPVPVIASTANLIATLRWQRSDAIHHHEQAQTIGFGIPYLFEMVTHQRARGDLPEDRFTDVRFADLMADHIGTIRRIYQGLGLELDDGAAVLMEQYLEARPKGRHGGRGYRFEDTGLDAAEIRTRAARYMAKFDIPEEPS